MRIRKLSRRTRRWQAILRVFSEGNTVWTSQNIKVNAVVTWDKVHLSTVGMWLLWLLKFGSVRKYFHPQQNDTEKTTKHFNWQWVVFSMWNSFQLWPKMCTTIFFLSTHSEISPRRTLRGGRSSIKVLAALPADDLLGLLLLFNAVIFIVCVFLAALGLWCCTQAFSGCGERRLLSVMMHRLVFVVASLAVKLGL